MSAVRLAPAKVNLALHVTGRRDDGFHLLDSLVGFAHFGDRLSLTTEPDREGPSVALQGPFADALAHEEDNLINRAADAMARETGLAVDGFDFTLEKNLPVASGIGGGSADAAAALHLVNGALGHPLSESGLRRVGEGLGADVPVCVRGMPVRMQGIGEQLTDVSFPSCGMVLVNPLQGVATHEVFKALDGKFGDGLPSETVWPDFASLIDFLQRTRNDLEAPAMQLCPAIGDIKAALQADPDCAFARMSGSGATVFGLCETEPQAAQVAQRLQAKARGWWAVATELVGR